MNYEKTLKLNGAILTQENLTELMNKLSEFFPKVEISVTYNDNLKISNIKTDEFHKMSFKNKHLHNIDIREMDWQSDESSSIWLRYSDYLEFYELNYEFSNYDKYIICSTVIDEWVTEVSDRKKYISILHSPIITLASFLLLFIPIINLVVKHSLNFAYLTLFSLISIGISVLISNSIKFSFPLTELDIGINKRKTFRKLIWGLMVILIIPILLNIFF